MPVGECVIVKEGTLLAASCLFEVTLQAEQILKAKEPVYFYRTLPVNHFEVPVMVDSSEWGSDL
jgi:hypothetical protein